MKFTYFFLMVGGALALHMAVFSMNQKQHEFCVQVGVACLQKGDAAEADWNNHFNKISRRDVQFAYAKQLNRKHALGLVADDIENVTASHTNRFDAKDNQQLLHFCKLDAQIMWACGRNKEAQEYWDQTNNLNTIYKGYTNRLGYLKEVNQLFSLGFDTQISNIENGVAIEPPIISPTVTVTQPDFTSAETTTPVEITAPLNPYTDISAQDFRQKVHVEAKTLSQTAEPSARGIPPTFTFSEVTITEEDIRNAIAEEPMVHLSDSDDEEGSASLKPISFTDEQKRNAQLPYKSTQYQDDAHKPSYTAMRFSRKSLFFGITILCAAGTVYRYRQRQKTKESAKDIAPEPNTSDTNSNE